MLNRRGLGGPLKVALAYLLLVQSIVAALGLGQLVHARQDAGGICAVAAAGAPQQGPAEQSPVTDATCILHCKLAGFVQPVLAPSLQILAQLTPEPDRGAVRPRSDPGPAGMIGGPPDARGPPRFLHLT
ncbi:hypothetical protein [Rhodoligotrophos defluvii]|uniref:hypothetical protein n=1 Tax=Rhodoligotrophos defluvii TaxID=2561934 RepID=UPI0010C9DB57|nr:hypothetical protein [Rhodoligotrophos defluvii]